MHRLDQIKLKSLFHNNFSYLARVSASTQQHEPDSYFTDSGNIYQQTTGAVFYIEGVKGTEAK